MKVILTALNSKFIHSNLAVRYLKACTRELNYNCIIKEFSINDRMEKVLEELMCEKPDILAFSCYIWNIEYVKKLATLVKLISPNTKILYGGPEVSYDSVSFLKYNSGDYIIYGEGEKTYYEFIKFQIELGNSNQEDKLKAVDLSVENNYAFNKEFLNRLKKIKGLCFRVGEDVIINEDRDLVDMNNINFPYSENDNLDNKIVYYEASRGCPFNCKYCLSSTTHGVRFLELERVKKELSFLVKKGVKLIKFVDRTFNCNANFANGIWRFIIGLETTATFHFEISADILTKEQTQILATAPVGKLQFEVGVQTTNNQVLRNINRHVNFEEIKEKVEELEKIKNIKQHLDLIAGLPGENLESFIKSFNDVYSINPEEIQLGFLKLLKGSLMREEAEKWGMVYSPYPPYEILRTRDISYDELLILKRIEEVLDKYYNSGKFNNILKYFLDKFKTPFDFYYDLGMFFHNKGYLNRNISSAEYYKVFIEFNEDKFNEDSTRLKEIIKYDYLKYNKKKWLPEFLIRERIKSEENEIKDRIIGGEINAPVDVHIEKFFINIKEFIDSGNIKDENVYILFDEKNKREIFI